MASVTAFEKLPFWSGLSAHGRERVAAGAQLSSFEAGQPVIACGDHVAGAYFVLEGALRVYFVNTEGREGTLYWVDQGQSCILALNCTFSRLAYPAWVESEGACQVMLIPGDLYRDLFAVEPAMQTFTFETLSTRLFELMALVEETASRGLETRLAAFLLRRADTAGALELTQEQIANHMATSREVVSRILRAFARSGFIAAGHHATERFGVRALAEHLAERFGLYCEFVDIDSPV